MNDLDFDFVVGKFFEALAHRFHGALDIGFYNDIQFFHFALVNGREQIVERDFVELVEFFFFGFAFSLFDQFTRQTLVGNRVKGVACLRHIDKAGNFHRHGRTGSFHALSAVVGHHTHTADRHTRDNRVAGF